MENGKNSRAKRFMVAMASMMLAGSVSVSASAADKEPINFETYHSLEATMIVKKDVNGDGELTLEEYIGTSKRINEKRRTRLGKKFANFDKDKSGTLDAAELMTMSRRSFNAKDKNKDGMLSADEMSPRKKKKKKKQK
ncbi:MAG: EF-hand domain-containing protein [Litorimonas sp.]